MRLRNVLRIAATLTVAMPLAIACSNTIGPDADQKPKELWVTSQGGSVIFIRQFENLSPIGQIDLPAGAGPHIITFHSPNFAYVGGMTDGNMYVIDAGNRQVVKTLKVGPTLAHQVKVTPDGSAALVSVIGTKTLVKILVDETNRSWVQDATLDIGAATTKAPICTVYRADSRRAFVSLNPSGIAVVDVIAMTYIKEIPTDGFVACGMIKLDDHRVVVASSGSGGHIYTLDMTAETMTDRGALGAPSWHSFIMTADGTRGFGSSPMSDEVIGIDLTTTPVTKAGSIKFDQVPGEANNQPDAFGGGEVLYGNVLQVGLRAAGSVANVDAYNLGLQTIVNLSPPTPFNPMTCGPVGAPTGSGGCAVHGVTPRPPR